VTAEKGQSGDLFKTVLILWNKSHELVHTDEPEEKSSKLEEYKFSDREWKDIQEGFDTTVSHKDQIVIAIGDQSKRMAEITSGSCIVLDSRGNKICTLNTGDIFNQLAILDPKVNNSVDIIAAETTQIKWIEAYYLQIYFQYHLGLAGKFYHKLAGTLSKDLHSLGYF